MTVAVHRHPAGAVDRLSVTATTEVDRGRHGRVLMEAGNREARLVEREIEIEMTPEQRAAGERSATAMAQGRQPDPADLRAVASGTGIEIGRRTYDTRHQAGSVDVSLPGVGVGGALSIDTADLREASPDDAAATPVPPGVPPRSPAS